MERRGRVCFAESGEFTPIYTVCDARTWRSPLGTQMSQSARRIGLHRFAVTGARPRGLGGSMELPARPRGPVSPVPGALEG